MANRTLRKLIVDGVSFLWRVDHSHRTGPDGGCAEVFTAFQSGYRRAGLRIRFPEGNGRGQGFPGQSGVVGDFRDGWFVNLHEPRTARLLVELGLSTGWAPTTAARDHVVENGFELLHRHSDQLRAVLSKALRVGSGP